jgi:peptide deformylase
MRTILPERENPVLRSIAREIPIDDIATPFIQKLIAEMKELLSHEEHGVALAAPQLGEPLRLFIVSGRALSERQSKNEKSQEDNDQIQDQVYINPVLLKISQAKTEKHEGCLSVRGKWGDVPRAEKATVRAYDESGNEFTRGASGFLAHIFQHEMDHLEGILYTDKATKLFDETDSVEPK